MTSKTTAERTAEIRRILKGEHDYTSRDVSVRVTPGHSIRVVMKSAHVDEAIVNEVAHRFETVHRDERTGDILRGGNTFVSVDWDSDLITATAAPFVEALEELESRPAGRAVRIAGRIRAWRIDDSANGLERFRWDVVGSHDDFENEIRRQVRGGDVFRGYNAAETAKAIARVILLTGIRYDEQEPENRRYRRHQRVRAANSHFSISTMTTP